jgi:hypothetical protein
MSDIASLMGGAYKAPQPFQPMENLPGMPQGGASGATPTRYDGIGQFAHGFTGVGGIQDAAGLAGGPSMRENWNNGHPIIAGLQATSALPFVGGVGKLAMAGMGMKAAKAASIGEEMANALRAGEAPTQAGRGNIISLSGGLDTAPERARAKDPRMYHYSLGPDKLSRPVGEFYATHTPTEGYAPRQYIDPQYFDGKNASIIAGPGDRSAGGFMLNSVNGHELTDPTLLEAGHDYMRGPAANGPDAAAWASGTDVVEGLARKTRSEVAAGWEPYLGYSAMGGTSVDFSHHMTDPILDLAKTSPITAEHLAEFNRQMRERTTKEWAPHPNFPGILAPNASEYLWGEGGANARKKLAQLMGKAEWQGRGMPDVPGIRFGTMDLGLLNTAPYAMGRSITKLDPAGRVVKDPKITHNTYPTVLGADRNVGYVGGFKHDMPLYVSHKEWVDNAMAQRPELADNTSQLIRKFTMSAPATRMTPEVIDRMSKYIKDVDSGRISPPKADDSVLWGSPYLKAQP